LQISNHASELFAFHALDGEILKPLPHPGRPGGQWVQEHLVTNFAASWASPTPDFDGDLE